MKKIPLLLCLLCGCVSTPKLLPTLVETGVATGASIGLSKYPTAVPFVTIGRDVICASAANQNVIPSIIVADLAKSPAAAAVKTAEGVMIVNAAFNLYNTVCASVGTNNAAKLQPYLQAVCDGLTEALPPAPGVSKTASASTKKARALPPHLE